MENLKDLYLEQEQKVTAEIAEIKHVDLWAEQISFMAEEHPFRAPALFFAYRILQADDQAEGIQQIRMQVDIYLFYETFADTARGSKKQAHALQFLDLLTKVHACFHGSSGNYYSDMTRKGFNPVETGTANLLYVQRYEFNCTDSSALKKFESTQFENMDIENEVATVPAPVREQLFDL
jgi:hypothetical protein